MCEILKILIPIGMCCIDISFISDNDTSFVGQSSDTNVKPSTDVNNTDQAHPLPSLTKAILEISEEDLSEYIWD